MKANLLPILSSIQRTIIPDVNLIRYRVKARSSKSPVLFFIDFHVCNGFVVVPRFCPCDTATDENCYKLPLSSMGIQIRVAPLLATAMTLYEQLQLPQSERALIVSGNYNLGESKDKPSRKTMLYFRCFLHSTYCKTYSCSRWDRNCFLLQ